MEREATRPPIAKAGEGDRSAASGTWLEQELVARLARCFPPGALSRNGLLRDFRDNLLEGVELGELATRRAIGPQLSRIDSPLALALNSFLPWRDHPASLELAGCSGFSALHFLLFCPTGMRGAPPTVPVLACGPQAVVAIEALALSWLRRPDRRHAAGHRELGEILGLGTWQAAAAGVGPAGEPLRHLAAARLYRIALALARNFPAVQRRLFYLFLEPPGARSTALFARHREELAWLEERSRGSAVEFGFASFADLWEAWSRTAPTPALREHARRLLARYVAPLTAWPRPVLVHCSAS
ncbi:hypothetical protein HRbin40_02688 [bacterium HR40]|nr:hypothetical protein HRbin40_02688 [bacterium HR40]